MAKIIINKMKVKHGKEDKKLCVKGGDTKMKSLFSKTEKSILEDFKIRLLSYYKIILLSFK